MSLFSVNFCIGTHLTILVMMLQNISNVLEKYRLFNTHTITDLDTIRQDRNLPFKYLTYNIYLNWITSFKWLFTLYFKHYDSS